MAQMRCALFGATMLAGMVGVAGPAAAADDGYQDVLSSVLTAVGVLTPDVSPEIDYRERAPLVLPPKNSLEKPVAAGTGRTAAWPQDPDVIKRRRAAEDARAPSPNLLGNPNQMLSKTDLLQGRTASADNSIRANRCHNQGNQRGCLVISPDELRAESARYQSSGLGDKQELAVGEEPERMYLTQPPKGYMKTTKTVKVTAEAPVPRSDESNPAAALVYRPTPADE